MRSRGIHLWTNLAIADAGDRGSLVHEVLRFALDNEVSVDSSYLARLYFWIPRTFPGTRALCAMAMAANGDQTAMGVLYKMLSMRGLETRVDAMRALSFTAVTGETIDALARALAKARSSLERALAIEFLAKAAWCAGPSELKRLRSILRLEARRRRSGEVREALERAVEDLSRLGISVRSVSNAMKPVSPRQRRARESVTRTVSRGGDGPGTRYE